MTNTVLTEYQDPRVNSIIEQIQKLTLVELATLMQVISQLLAPTGREEIKKSRVMNDPSEAKADFWPEDETVDEFLTFLKEERTPYPPIEQKEVMEK